MSLGIAVTVSLIGIIAIYSKKSVLKFAKTEVITKITTIIQIAGAALVLFFGLLMFLSRLI
jgi:ABC-type nickel/cobalt efflux system permease component RcnA